MEKQNETEVTPEAKLKLAGEAIQYALHRIRDDESIRYHMGAMTEAYERLKTAHCVLTGYTPETVDKEILDTPLGVSATEKINEIRDTINANRTTAPAEVIDMILNIIN